MSLSGDGPDPDEFDFTDPEELVAFLRGKAEAASRVSEDNRGDGVVYQRYRARELAFKEMANTIEREAGLLSVGDKP